MKNYHQDYFYMCATGNNTPMLGFDRNQMTDPHLLYSRRPIDKEHVFTFKFISPTPRKPKLGDVLEKDQHLIISNKLKELLQSMSLNNVQFIPAEIDNPEDSDKPYTNYWVLHIYNMIEGLDMERSRYKIINERVGMIDLLIFDHEKINTIPEEQRLIFALSEQRLYMFFHRSVMEKIIALQPENIEFRSLVAQKELDNPFDEEFLKYIVFPVVKEKRNTPRLSLKEILERDRLKFGGK